MNDDRFFFSFKSETDLNHFSNLKLELTKNESDKFLS